MKELQSLPKPTDKSEEQLGAELQQAENEQKTLTAQRAAKEESLDNYDMLIDKRVCPTCERPIEDPSVYMEKRNRMRQDVNTLLDKEGKTEGCKLAASKPGLFSGR